MLKELLIPIIQAPMLGASTPAMAAAVSRAGGLGSLAPGLSADAMAKARRPCAPLPTGRSR